MARELRVVIVGDASSLQRALGTSAAATDSFGSRMSAAGARISSVGRRLTRDLTLPIVAIGAVAVKTATDFQSSMELIHTQAHVSQGAVDDLSKSVLSMAGSVATGPRDLSVALYHLASQGLRGKEALDALRASAEGAKVGQANLEDVTNALGAVLVAHISGIHSYQQAMGELNAVVGAGDMHMQDLADAMGTGLAAVAKTAHISLDQVGGALATFGDNNIRGAKAGTLLISTMRVLGHQSKAAVGALAELGVSSDTLQAKLAHGGLTDAIGYLNERIKESGKAGYQVSSLLSEAFGGKQSTGIKILVNELERLRTKVAAVAQGGNTFGADWAATTQTAKFKFDQLKASLEAGAITLGNQLIPIVLKAIGVFERLRAWFENLSPSAKKVIEIAIGVAAAIGPIAMVVGPVVSAIAALATAFTTVGAAVALPVIAVTALGVAFAGAMLFPRQFQDMLEKMGLSATTSARIVGDLRKAFEDLKTVTMAVFNFLKPLIVDTLGVIKDQFQIVSDLLHGRWSQAWSDFEHYIEDIFHLLGDFLRGQVSLLGDVAGMIGHAVMHGIVDPLVKLADELLHTIEGALSSAINDIASWVVGEAAQIGRAMVSGILGGLGGLASRVGRFVHHALSSAWRFAGNVLHGSGEFHFTKYAGQGMVDGVIEGLNGLEGATKTKTATDIAQALQSIAPTVTAAADALGVKAVDAVVAGTAGLQQSLASQLRTALTQAIQQAASAVTSAQGSLISAFQSMAQSALSAFDNVTSNWVPPATKTLEKMQAQDQQTQLQQNLTQAEQGITSALQAQQAAGTDPAKQAAALQQLQTAYQQYVAAKRAIQENQLQQEAVTQQAAYDKRRANQRESLAHELVDLQQNLLRHPQEWKQTQDKVMAVLAKYNVPLFQQGQRFASQLAAGLTSQIAAVEKAAESLAQAVAKYIVTHSPAQAGPLAEASPFDLGLRVGRGFSQGVVAGVGGNALSSALGAGLATPTHGVGAAGAGGGTVQITVNVPQGFVGSSQEIVDGLTQVLVRAGNNGHPLWKNLTRLA